MSRDYKEKDVNGAIIDVIRMNIKPTKVTVRMTADNRGKSLSLSAYNIMIEIPLESVSEIIKLAD